MSNGKKSYGQIIILIVVVSLFFIPNSAFADVSGPFDFVPGLLLLISIVIVPIALTYLGIISLRSFKPSLGNYILSNRFIVKGLCFLGGGIGCASMLAFAGGVEYLSYALLGLLLLILAILLISIGGTLIIKYYNDNKILKNS